MSIVYDMFGKSISELTPEELREYKRANKRRQQREKARRNAGYREYRSSIFEDNFGKYFTDELTDDEFGILYRQV